MAMETFLYNIAEDTIIVGFSSPTPYRIAKLGTQAANGSFHPREEVPIAYL
jgi:hypothetical protein